MHEQAVILIVDDIAANRNFLGDILMSQGYRVKAASGGEEALRMLGNERPDLVLLDVLMPDLNGYEVCKQVRSDPATGLLPIIMVTALDASQERVRGLEAGADDFVTKPINQAELLARVRSLLRIKSLYDTVQTQAGELAKLNTNLAQRVAQQVSELQRLEQLKRFFSPTLAQHILEGDVDDPMRTRRCEVTVVLLDLRGFTAFADIAEPEEVMTLLRTYRAEMGKLIDAHEGTLERFTGDAMMVIFNDPVLMEESASHAVRMALAMQARAGEILQSYRRQGIDLDLGIGIAHGYATIGNIGHGSHLTYGVVGRVTNLASRLSREAEPGEVLVSASAFTQCERSVTALETRQVNLEGFVRPIAVFRVLGLRKTAIQEQRWPVRIFTLGQFKLTVQDQALVFSRKTQRKPLDLLRMLIAHGGVRVEAAALIHDLWPDSEGDAAKVTFDSTLYRLRKLVGVEDCLILAEGKLSLNQTQCWIDAWALDALIAKIERLNEAGDAGRSISNELCRDLLKLYAGHFLAPESNESSVITARDKLKAKFIRAISILGARMEAHRQWDQAASLYARALELDNLAEGLYRRLMIAYREQGEPAQALNVYRRCRDMLSVVLGAKPSPETEMVRASVE